LDGEELVWKGHYKYMTGGVKRCQAAARTNASNIRDVPESQDPDSQVTGINTLNKDVLQGF
jgi:hypothetical protein